MGLIVWGQETIHHREESGTEQKDLSLVSESGTCVHTLEGPLAN
jgi:hypothetical protein